MSRPSLALLRCLASALLPFICTAQLLPGDSESTDFYCGTGWEDAHSTCNLPCPSGRDTDCPPADDAGALLEPTPRRCFAAADCFARFRTVYWTGVVSLSFEKAEVAAADGSAGLMTAQDKRSLASTFGDGLRAALEGELNQLTLDVTVREYEYDRPCVAVVNGGDDPTATSLDMIVQFAAEYLPPAGDDVLAEEQFGETVLAAIRADPQALAESIRAQSTPFFGAVVGIAAIDQESVAAAPSSSPSEAPSRFFDQALEIRIDPWPTGSYGLVFNVRTYRCDDGAPAGRYCGTILLTGMSFLTSEGRMEYEIYSREGPFQRFIGITDEWDLIASGQTDGRGKREYTRVLEENTAAVEAGTTLNYAGFKPVHVRGDRGQRSFYVTATKRFTTDKGAPIPIMFSGSIADDVEGTRDYQVVASSPELEVYEGDGVLDYPWPRDRKGPYYRRPRGFIGSFDYERYPCHPVLDFAGWPCPYVPKTYAPTSDSTLRPSKAPTRVSTGVPTVAEVQTVPINNWTESSASEPVLPSGSRKETDDISDEALTVGLQDEKTSDGVVLLWNVMHRCAVLLLMYHVI